jgi:hypothetical protein
MDFFFFLLVNAVLFLRPAELLPDLERLPLYYYAILACLAVSVPKLLGLISPGSPLKHPITLCVFAVSGFVMLAHFVQSDPGKMAEESFEFFKIVVYFVLFLALVNTPGKLQLLINCVILFGVVATTVAVLMYHEVISLPHLMVSDSPHGNTSFWMNEFMFDPDTGELVRIARLRITGILHDPNEFGVFLGVLALFTLHQLGNRNIGIVRFLWSAPLGLFLYGIFLTKSRGALLALLVGLVAYGIYAYGAKRAMRYGLIVLPLLIAVFAGRQTTLSVSSGTGRERIELWSDWIMKFRGSPVFGISPVIAEGSKEAKKEERQWKTEKLAHNSFLQAFADLGFLGGIAFLGAFLFAFRTLSKYAFDEVAIVDENQRRFYPYLLGAVVVYAMGMMTLSLCYVVPTYFMLALPVAYWRMTATDPPVPALTFNGPMVRQLMFASVGFLAFIYVVVRVVRV